MAASRTAVFCAVGSAATAGGGSAKAVALAEGMVRGILLSKRKIAATMVLAVSLVGVEAGLVAQQALRLQAPAAVPIQRSDAAAKPEDARKPESPKQPESKPTSALSVFTLRAKLHGHTGSVYCLSFGPDGRVLASGGRDRTVQLWNAITGKRMATLEGHAGSVWSLAISPDGKTLVAGSGRFDERRQQYLSGEMKAWNLAQRVNKQTVQGHAKVVNALAFSPDGRLLASASDDATVKLWDMADGQMKLKQVVYDARAIPVRLNRGPPDAVGSVVFGSDGKLLAWGGSYYEIRFWDIATSQEKARMEGHSGGIRSVAFSPDGKMLASAAFDFAKGGVCIKLWEMLTAQERASFDFTGQQTSGFHCLAFDRTGRTLLAGDNNGVVRQWNLAAGKLSTILDDKDSSVYSLQFSPDGAVLAASRSDGSVVLWDRVRANQGQQLSVELSKKELDGQWTELLEADARRAYRAMCRLIRSPQATVAFLAQQLQPARPVEQRRLTELIEDLDHASVAARETALRELEQLGTLAEPALRTARKDHPSAEVQRRVELLLEKFQAGILPSDVVRALRALEILESVGTPKAKQVLQTLAKGAPEARLTQEAEASLERLAKRP